VQRCIHSAVRRHATLYNDGCGGRIAHRREWVSGWVDEWVGVPEERTRDERGVKKKQKFPMKKILRSNDRSPQSAIWRQSASVC